MITNIFLKNWRSHFETEIKFSEGTNCFIGNSGSGKTTVLDALCFALFGTFPLLQQKKLKLEDIVMKKPKKQTTAEVEVVFEIGDEEYRVKRKIENGRTVQTELRKDNELVEAQSQKVTEEIEKILKIDYDLFTRAVYSEQNQLDMFLTIPKGQRMKKIDELLGLDKFEKIRLSTVSLINKCNSSKEEKQDVVSSLEKDENLKNLETLKNEMQSIEKERGKLKSDLISIKTKKEEMSKKILEMQMEEKDLQGVSEKIKSLTSAYEQVKNDTEEIEKILDKKTTLEELEKRAEGMTSEIKILEKNIEGEREILDNLKRSIANNQALANLIGFSKIPELEKKIGERKKIESMLRGGRLEKSARQFEEKTKALEEDLLTFQTLKVKTEELEKSVKELANSSGKCPVCDTELEDKKRKELIEKREMEIKTFGEKSSKLNMQATKLREEINELKTSLDEMKVLREKISELPAEEELEKQKEELSKLDEQIKRDSTEAKMLEKIVQVASKNFEKLIIENEQLKQSISKMRELEKKQDLCKELRGKISLLDDEKKNIEKIFSKELLENSRKEAENAIGIEKTLEAKIENIHVLEKEKSKRIEGLDSKKKMLEEYKLKIRRLEALEYQLQLLESALVTTQEQLRKNFVSAVNQAMHEVWQEIYPYGDFFSARLGIEGDYVLQLQDNTGWVAADVVSGGERSITCLALRIAFALVLAPQLRWLILDEPTANLDDKTIDTLAAVLRERISQLVEQCFLITHDEKLKEAVSGFCYSFDRDKSKDSITKVSLVSSAI